MLDFNFSTTGAEFEVFRAGFFPGWGRAGIIPQTVLALWGSGVFKAGDCTSGFPASRTFPDTENH